MIWIEISREVLIGGDSDHMEYMWQWVMIGIQALSLTCELWHDEDS